MDAERRSKFPSIQFSNSFIITSTRFEFREKTLTCERQPNQVATAAMIWLRSTAGGYISQIWQAAKKGNVRGLSAASLKALARCWCRSAATLKPRFAMGGLRTVSSVDQHRWQPRLLSFYLLVSLGSRTPKLVVEQPQSTAFDLPTIEDFREFLRV